MSKLEPNFFVVGAPKCGTTALSDYLRDHPNIFVSTPKEPHYFATDMPGYRSCNVLEAYLQLFAEAHDNHHAVGEASVYYLYSQEALSNIREFNADAKIIAMLRDPVDMVHSLHSQLFVSRNENVKDFEKAWQLEAKRKEGQHIPPHCRDASVLYYSEIANYPEQLKRVYRYFPKEQVKVILYEEFAQATAEVYRQVLDFLDVPDDRRREFPVVNANKQPKSSLLADFTQRTPDAAKALATQVKTFLGIERLGVLNRLRDYNFERVKREPLSEAMRHKVVATYRESVSELANMLGRDLSGWLAAPSVAAQDKQVVRNLS